jgi:uncharacterized protein (DUF885 family)
VNAPQQPLPRNIPKAKEITSVTLSKELASAMTDPVVAPVDENLLAQKIAATSTTSSEAQLQQVIAALKPELENIIKKSVQEAIWKLVPEIATNLIKEEIKRLTGDDK